MQRERGLACVGAREGELGELSEDVARPSPGLRAHPPQPGSFAPGFGAA
jgi:hypothetical protein